jgi:CheY-like chemotaxis protein
MPPEDPKHRDNLRHDLLANIHTLVGAVELLLTTRLTTRQRRYLDVCKRSIGTLTELGRQMSTDARAETAPRPIVDELAELGANYLPKPVTRSGLLQAIRKVSGSRHPRVLVAEDSVDSCMLIVQYLKDAAQVDLVHDGRGAFEKVQAQVYDLLIIDLEMPVMDGFSAIRAIRAWEAEQNRPHSPVIVLTAHDLISPMTKREERATGADSEEILVELDPEIAHLVPGFLATRRHDVQTILQALTDSNYDLIQTVGHQLKGAGGGYGFDGISAIGHRLEEGGEKQDFHQIRQAVTDLAGYLDRVTVACTEAQDLSAPVVAAPEPASIDVRQ